MAIGVWLAVTGGWGTRVYALDAGPLKASTYELTIRPEYDKPQVLVINQAFLTNTTSTPYQGWIGLRVPKGAELQMVCEVRPDGGHACQPYRSEDKGEYLEITWKNTRPIVQSDNFPIYVEYYYDPFTSRSPRQFTHVLNSIYPIDLLDVQVTEPKGATGFKLSPPGAASLPPDQQGFTTWRYLLNNVPAGPKPFAVTYQRATDAPSIAPPPEEKGASGSSAGSSGGGATGTSAGQAAPPPSLRQGNQSGLFLLAVALAGAILLLVRWSTKGKQRGE
ncbi:MAG: hypothetical protein ACM3RP_03510 [Chitinophagales bacterium]